MIAPTGSGKTLAYLLPVAERWSAAREGKAVLDQEASRRLPTTERRTMLVVAPTRELSVQLASDVRKVLGEPGSGDAVTRGVQLAIAGADPPTAEELDSATALVGTPDEVRGEGRE